MSHWPVNSAAAVALASGAVSALAAQPATALPAPGTVAHFGRGDLVIGSKDVALQPRLQEVAALFAGAQVPVVVSAEVMVELWRKLMLNCAYNAISALAQQPYGRMAALPAIREVQHAMVREVVAVARELTGFVWAIGREVQSSAWPGPSGTAPHCALRVSSARNGDTGCSRVAVVVRK